MREVTPGLRLPIGSVDDHEGAARQAELRVHDVGDRDGLARLQLDRDRSEDGEPCGRTESVAGRGAAFVQRDSLALAGVGAAPVPAAGTMSVAAVAEKGSAATAAARSDAELHVCLLCYCVCCPRYGGWHDIVQRK